MKFSIIVVCLITACLPTPPAPVAPVQELPKNVAVVTALKHTVFFKGPGCTAVDIGHGRLVTAKHCVDELKLGDKTSIGMLAYVSADRDFAVLISQERIKNSPAELRAPRLGEHVYAVGYPVQLATKQQELTVTDGVVSGPSDKEGSLRFTAPIYYGNSGGGVWAEDGSLIGISVSGFLQMPGMNFLVSAEDIAKALG